MNEYAIGGMKLFPAMFLKIPQSDDFGIKKK